MSLDRAVLRFSKARSLEEAAKWTLKATMEGTGAVVGRLYFLELLRSRFDLYAMRNKTIVPITTHHHLWGEADTELLQRWHELASAAADYFFDYTGELKKNRPRSSKQHITPILRHGGTIGFIVLDFSSDVPTSVLEVRSLQCFASLFVSIFDQKFSSNLLAHLQEPVDFRVDDHLFYENLARVAAASAGVQFLVLRELTTEGGLRCIAVRGFDMTVGLDGWDISDIEGVPPIAQAIHSGKSISINNVAPDTYPGFIGQPFAELVRGFTVCPLTTGTEIFGAISYGCGCPYAFSDLEQRGYETVASAAAIAIQNFRNYHKASMDLTKHSQAAVAITGLEVAQAARHEAKNIIDSCQLRIATILTKLRGIDPTLGQELSTLSSELREITGVLEKIRSATRPPRRELQFVSLKNIWADAREQIRGRLISLQVDAQYDGPDIQIEVYPDWFRQVFLNLLLNSADAFSLRSGARRNRKIRLHVLALSERQNTIAMTYTDNAAGIDPSQLRIPEKLADVKLEQVVFAPNVSSKEDGSGWGLYLVRKILDDHRGSIDLLDYRRGVTFRIELPKAAPRGVMQ